MALRHFLIPGTPLSPGAPVSLPAALQHRLAKVLRLGEGAELALANGQSPLYAATVADPKCRTATLGPVLRPFAAPRPLTLALAMPKREAWESALRQATELGVTRIIPLKTAYSQVARINEDRAHLHLQEAAEQSERLTLPELTAPQTLASFLNALQESAALAYERHDPTQTTPAKAAILVVGPEGGFSPEEIEQLIAHPHIKPFSLGPTILRVDTAVVAALARLA